MVMLEIFNLRENPHPERVSGLHKISSEKSHRNFSVNYVHHVTSYANIGDVSPDFAARMWR